MSGSRAPRRTLSQTIAPATREGWRSHGWTRYGLAVVYAVAAALFRSLLEHSVGFSFVFVTFYPAVMLASLLHGAGPGALTTLVSALCADYFFIEPRGLPAVQNPADLIALTVFVATGLGLSGVMTLLQRRSKQHEARFWVWLEAAPDGIVLVNSDGNIVFANQQLERLFGYDKGELQGRRIEMLVPQRFREAHYSSRTHYATAPAPRVMGTGPIIHGLRKDGSEFPADASLNPMNLGGEVLTCAVVRDVTERVKAEQDLRTNEERFRVALKSSPVVVFNQDQDLRYTWINNPVFAWAEQGWLGKTDEDILEPESAARLTAIKRRVLETGIGVREEVQVSQGGRSAYYDLTVEPVRTAAGQVVGITCASTDITERKATEREIREREAQLNAFFDSSPAGMALLSTDLRYLKVNQPLARINGPQVHEHLGKTIDEVLPALAPTLKPMFERIIEKGESFLNLEVSGQVPGAPGEMRHWLVSYFPVRDSEGKATAAGGVVIDITENKRLEDALYKERDFVEALLENLAEGIVACDADGHLTRFNRASEEIHGIPRHAVPPEAWAEHYDIYLPDSQRHAAMEEVPLFRALRGERVKDAEFLVVPKGGDPRFVSVSGGPIDDDLGHRLGAVIAMRDITGHRQLKEQLLQSQKLEAIGRLAGGVAHDFNNIIGVIMGFGQLLAERFPKDQPIRELTAIREAAERAASLTRQLLAFGRKQVMRPRVINLNPLVVELSNMLHRLIRENIELIVKNEPGLGLVKADPAQIEQVLMNLVVNARDAMPKGGQLVIATANVELESLYTLAHPSLNPGSYVMVSVSDTGVGMDAETRAHLFEPFFTTKGLGRGTGLGLSIVYGIVMQSGGHISVDSAPGDGTTFRIYFPRLRGEVEQSEKNRLLDAPTSHGPASGETILVVEDESALADVTRSMLESRSYNVLLANSVEEALNIAETYRGEIQLVLTDVILRGNLDGVELAEKLKEIRPTLKVLLMSGYNEVLLDGNVANDHLLLQKPFTSDQLRALVWKALGKK